LQPDAGPTYSKNPSFTGKIQTAARATQTIAVDPRRAPAPVVRSRLTCTWRLLTFDYGRRLLACGDSSYSVDDSPTLRTHIEEERPPTRKPGVVRTHVGRGRGNSILWILLQSLLLRNRVLPPTADSFAPDHSRRHELLGRPSSTTNTRAATGTRRSASWLGSLSAVM